MRVGFAVDVDFPNVGEVRPRKMGQSLHQFGHHVVFICANQRTKPLTEDLAFGRVYRFGWFLRSRLFPLLSASLPLNPFWVLWLVKVARKEQLEALVSSNLRLALPTIAAARWLRIPAVVDLQENNREAVKLYRKTRVWHYVMRNSRLVGLLENLCVRLADHTWVVVEERLDGLPAKPLARGKVSVVCHTPSPEELGPAPQKTGTCHESFNLIYLGLFSPGVGSIEPILKALPHVLAKDKNVRFIIGGGGDYLYPLVQELGIQDHVLFDGIIESGEVPAWLRKGDLGIIAYPVNAFTNTTVSNKVFHYMAAGIPILSTDMAPTRRILNEVGCGLIIPEGSSSQDIAELILALKSYSAERTAMGCRGRAAVATKYNWAVDFGHVLNCLKKLVLKGAGEGPASRPSQIGDAVSGHGS